MKLFASDFDNTLHFNDGVNGYYKDYDIEAVNMFRNAGNFFGLCTGRPGNGFGTDLDQAPEMDFMIVSTGSLIRDCNGNTLYEARIPCKDIEELDSLTGEEGDLYIHANGDVYTLRCRRSQYPQQTVVQLVSDIADLHITGVSIHTPSLENASSLTERLNKSFKSELIAFQNQNWLDVIKKGNSKGIAALKAGEIFNADLVAGIGDSFNDIELIRKADVSFTFPYAPDALKCEADYIVDSVAEAIDILMKM